MNQPQRRFTVQKKHGHPLTLRADHPAVIEGRTLFPSRVTDIHTRLLKPGANQRKIGSHVSKGRWIGMPIYTITLEERATCPRSCEHWNDCYGNHMHWPKRHRHGIELEEKLAVELQDLERKFPAGFVVRLHILGDFYSPEYVRIWRAFMGIFKQLRIFGYTARERTSEIGIELEKNLNLFPDRWWIRWSHRDDETWMSTGKSGIVCPAQTGKTECCGTCALCWTAHKPIKFLLH